MPQEHILACAEASLERCEAILSLVITHDPAFPNREGEAMEQAMVIDALFTASGDFNNCDTGVSVETTVEATTATVWLPAS